VRTGEARITKAAASHVARYLCVSSRRWRSVVALSEDPHGSSQPPALLGGHGTIASRFRHRGPVILVFFGTIGARIVLVTPQDRSPGRHSASI
jgi:hypothetical protein